MSQAMRRTKCQGRRLAGGGRPPTTPRTPPTWRSDKTSKTPRTRRRLPWYANLFLELRLPCVGATKEDSFANAGGGLLR